MLSWISLRHSLSQPVIHSFIHSFRQTQNTRAIKMQFAWNVLNICLTLPTTGGIGRAGGAGEAGEAGQTHTHSAGHTNRAIEIASKFHNCKVFSRKCPQAALFDIFITGRAGQAVAGAGGVATPTSVHSECSPPPAPPTYACIHTDCAYAALPCGFGMRFIVELPVPGLPMLPASLIFPLNSWLTNLAGFQLRPRSRRGGGVAEGAHKNARKGFALRANTKTNKYRVFALSCCSRKGKQNGANKRKSGLENSKRGKKQSSSLGKGGSEIFPLTSTTFVVSATGSCTHALTHCSHTHSFTHSLLIHSTHSFTQLIHL